MGHRPSVIPSVAGRAPSTMRVASVAVVLVVAVSVLGACGGDDTSSASTSTGAVPTSSTVAPSSSSSSSSTTTSSASSTSSTSSSVAPDDRVVAWPPKGETFSTPEAVAADFTARVFGTGAVLGAFRAGDMRSGEIDVFASDEAGRPLGSVRSTLLLRQVGTDDAWSVLAAVSEGASIRTPAGGDTVSGVVTVAGRARGFEANVNVRAVAVRNPDVALDEQTTMGGNLDQPRRYRVDLDLSQATAGDVVLLVVHGGAGLETDPGDTAVIPVVIG